MRNKNVLVVDTWRVTILFAFVGQRSQARTCNTAAARFSGKGFTLIELLVVISIIGLLASVVLASLADARASAQTAAAQQEVRSLLAGVQALITDTGKAPNGCPFNRVANPEVSLNSNQSGLLTRPVAQDNGWGCVWTTAEVARWNGPYVQSVIDPYGNSYWYDPDYIPYRNCSERPELPVIQALVSRGADLAWYSCDDVYIELQ